MSDVQWCFSSGLEDDWEFDGELSVGVGDCHLQYLNSVLDKENTRELYEAMKEYYGEK